MVSLSHRCSPVREYLTVSGVLVMVKYAHLLLRFPHSILSFMSNTSIKTSESSFKNQVELAREALATFNTVRDLNAPGIVRSALNDLIDKTAAFNQYVPYFLSHPSFLEIPPAVFSSIENFRTSHPSFEIPPSFAKVSGLDARVRDALNTKKVSPTPTGPRSDRIQKFKGPVSPFFSFSFSRLYFSFLEAGQTYSFI